MGKVTILINGASFRALLQQASARGQLSCDPKECSKISVIFWHMVDGNWKRCAQELNQKTEEVTLFTSGKKEACVKMRKNGTFILTE